MAQRSDLRLDGALAGERVAREGGAVAVQLDYLAEVAGHGLGQCYLVDLAGRDPSVTDFQEVMANYAVPSNILSYKCIRVESCHFESRTSEHCDYQGRCCKEDLNKSSIKIHLRFEDR